MRGRKPKPTTLHVAQGTFNATRHADRASEPRPDVKVPSAPAMVAKNDTASEEWERICRELLSLGLMTELDRGAIAAYCMSYSRWAEAEANLADESLTVATEKSVIVNPLVTVANQAMENMRKFLIEFGMTPSSRARVRGTEQPKKDNGKSRFFAG